MIKCPICGCAKMIWEKEIPKEPGIYFYYHPDILSKDQFLTMQVSETKKDIGLWAETLTQNSNLYFFSSVNLLDGEWIGPLPLPRKRK